jgi:hypothetical protein
MPPPNPYSYHLNHLSGVTVGLAVVTDVPPMVHVCAKCQEAYYVECRNVTFCAACDDGNRHRAHTHECTHTLTRANTRTPAHTRTTNHAHLQPDTNTPTQTNTHKYAQVFVMRACQ